MGTMSSPCASTHASASWAAVTPFSCAIRSISWKGDVPVEILAGEAWVEAAEIVLGKVARAFDLAGEEAAPERAVSDIGDAELAHRRQYLRLRITAPERIFGLQRGDR